MAKLIDQQKREIVNLIKSSTWGVLELVKLELEEDYKNTQLTGANEFETLKNAISTDAKILALNQYFKALFDYARDVTK